jgi:hypothetical protein
MYTDPRWDIDDLLSCASPEEAEVSEVVDVQAGGGMPQYELQVSPGGVFQILPTAEFRSAVG